VYASVVLMACVALTGCSSVVSRPGSAPPTGAPPSSAPPSSVPPSGALLDGAPNSGAPRRSQQTQGETSDVPAATKSPATRRSGSSGTPSTVTKGGTPSTVAEPRGVSTAHGGVASRAGCVPTALKIPSVGISEDVRALGLNAQGQIYPPRRTTMWYSGSALPGQDGISVIAGHVTYDGPDNFYNLVKVTPGAVVDLQCPSGSPVRLRAVRTASVPKTALQTDQSVWGSSPSPVVVLITCDLNSRVVKGHHLNNFVVWTSPV